MFKGFEKAAECLLGAALMAGCSDSGDTSFQEPTSGPTAKRCKIVHVP